MAGSQQYSTIVSTKGQVILPKAIRDQLHWESGTRLMVEGQGDGVLLKAALVFAATQPKDVFGSLPRRGRRKTVADMKFTNKTKTKSRHDRNR